VADTLLSFVDSGPADGNPPERQRRLRFATPPLQQSPPAPMRRVSSSPGALHRMPMGVPTPSRRTRRDDAPASLEVAEALQTLRHLLAAGLAVGCTMLMVCNAGAVWEAAAMVPSGECLAAALGSAILGPSTSSSPACSPAAISGNRAAVPPESASHSPTDAAAEPHAGLAIAVAGLIAFVTVLGAAGRTGMEIRLRSSSARSDRLTK